WLALCATNLEAVPNYLQQAGLDSAWENSTWGLDHTAITRRLARVWRLPHWLAAVVGNLGLHVSIAEKLGAEPALFRVVQLAIAIVHERRGGVRLALGDDVEGLRLGLGLCAEDLEHAADDLPEPPSRIWDDPADRPYLE